MRIKQYKLTIYRVLHIYMRMTLSIVLVFGAVLALNSCLLGFLPLTDATNLAYAVPAEDSAQGQGQQQNQDSSQDAMLQTAVRADTTPVDNPLQQQVINTAAIYNQALADLAAAETQTKDIQSRISDITEELKTQKEKSSDAAATFYRMHSSSNVVLELLFSAQSFSELAVRFEYISRVQDNYYSEIERLSTLKGELENKEVELTRALQEAQAVAVRAEEALADAIAVRKELMPSMGEFLDRESFVEHWAPRINAYLAGSPLSGYGEDFAAAAWNYGVDPRVSPSISCIESSKGAHCFLPHNAWGWGQKSWPDWPTAIDAHVSGFAQGYGYMITLDGAQKYTPPSWETWYPKVLGEMSRI